MQILQDVLNQLQAIEIELLYVAHEAGQRAKLQSRMPGLDLNGFDLTDEHTRSQLVIPLPDPIPVSWRFDKLIKDLRVQIKAAKVYLAIDVYPYAKAEGRVVRLRPQSSVMENL